jgi:hypothetical protein
MAAAAWAKLVLAEAKADLIVQSDDAQVTFVTDDRVQSFFFSGDAPESGEPTTNGAGGLGEAADGQFYAGTLEALADQATPWQITFDDGDVEPVR